jgi:hypothetical protein
MLEVHPILDKPSCMALPEKVSKPNYAIYYQADPARPEALNLIHVESREGVNKKLMVNMSTSTFYDYRISTDATHIIVWNVWQIKANGSDHGDIIDERGGSPVIPNGYSHLELLQPFGAIPDVINGLNGLNPQMRRFDTYSGQGAQIRRFDGLLSYLDRPQHIRPLVSGDTNHPPSDPPQGEGEYRHSESGQSRYIIPVVVNNVGDCPPQVVPGSNEKNPKGGTVFIVGAVGLLAFVWWTMKRG